MLKLYDCEIITWCLFFRTGRRGWNWSAKYIHILSKKYENHLARITYPLKLKGGPTLCDWLIVTIKKSTKACFKRRASHAPNALKQ
jgi:hypothetical protein